MKQTDSKSQTEITERKKELRKIAAGMRWCSFVKMKDIYLHFSSLLDYLFTKCQNNGFYTVDVLHLAGFSVSYSEVLKFQNFDDFVGDSELESENIF